MKILHVNDHYSERGGVEQYLLAVARLLAANGHANAILYRHQTPHTIRDGPWPAYRVEVDEAEAVAAALRQVIEEERPDVAYIHHVASPLLVETVARILPSVAYMHGFAAVCPGLAKYFRRGDEVCQRPFGWGCVPMHYLRRCSAACHPLTLARLLQTAAQLRQAYMGVPRILAATPYMKTLLAQNGFAADRITLLAPHFLTPDEISPYRPPERSDTILYVGRLEIEKGVPHLLDALRVLPGHVRLVMAGDGTLRTDYEHLTQSLGLTNRVLFTGWLEQSELEMWYRRCAAVVMPSVFPEPFGKSGIEALTQGRPVVAFAVGGIPNWLEDGVTGLLAQPADNTDLARKTQGLLEDRSRQDSMGRQGQRVVAERYATDRHLVTLEAVLHDVCDARG